MNRRTFKLFLFTSFSAGFALCVGWILGLVIDSTQGGFVGGLVGGLFGSIVGVEIAFRRRLVEVHYDDLLWRSAVAGFWGGGLVAAINELHVALVAIFAVVGSGLGAIAAKYALRFFKHEKPLSIR